MSHAAELYVKHLMACPNGQGISAREKLVLTLLAENHREEVGVAWPSIRVLAIQAGFKPNLNGIRNCRKVLANLERKGVIRRIANVRERDGAQTSNEYIFVQLAVPEYLQGTVTEHKRKLQSVPRSRQTGGVGRNRPPTPVKTDLAPRSKRTGGGGLFEPGKDFEFDLEVDSEVDSKAEGKPTPLPPLQGGVNHNSHAQPQPAEAERWRMLKAILKKDLHDNAPLHGKHFVELQAGQDDFDAAFCDIELVDLRLVLGGDTERAVFTVGHPQPALLDRAVKKYHKRLAAAVHKCFEIPGRVEIKFQVCEPAR